MSVVYNMRPEGVVGCRTLPPADGFLVALPEVDSEMPRCRRRVARGLTTLALRAVTEPPEGHVAGSLRWKGGSQRGSGLASPGAGADGYAPCSEDGIGSSQAGNGVPLRWLLPPWIPGVYE